MAPRASRTLGQVTAESKPLPYGRHSVDDDDIRAVVDVLCSDWLTTGPAVDQFESAVARRVGAAHGVAVSSGTAALHAITRALGIGPGDEVIVPPITFAATANAVLYEGGTPVFADVEPDTLLLDPSQVEAKITARTKAIIAVDYAGQPCDYDRLRTIAGRHGLALVADGCHALGATYKQRPVGALADMTAFSFHPVKHITTGEGGMVTTDDPEFARRMRQFRNHGISTDHWQRARQGSWYYEVAELGYNYRITDFQCALGMSQLHRLDLWLARRSAIAASYERLFLGANGVRPLAVAPNIGHAYHLFVVKVQGDRQAIFSELRARGIGVNVHYIPVHLHPLYREKLGTRPGLCPNAEAAYEAILSLPMFPGMSDDDVLRVADSVLELGLGYLMDLVIRADASVRIGTGHVMRCLALAEHWQGNVHFVSCGMVGNIVARMHEEKFHFYRASDSAEARQVIAGIVHEAPIQAVVFDGYGFTVADHRYAAALGVGVVVIDDNAHQSEYHANVLVNQNLYANDLSYSVSDDCQLLLGTEYAMLRKEFISNRALPRERDAPPFTVLVTMGGSDPENVTPRILDACRRVEGIHIIVVAGGANPRITELQKIVEGNPRIRVEAGVQKMAELMAQADIAITAAGSTCWECCYMSLPMMTVVVADNQHRNAAALGRSGAAINLGCHEHLVIESVAEEIRALCSNAARRRSMSTVASRLVDGKGASRVVEVTAGCRVQRKGDAR